MNQIFFNFAGYVCKISGPKKQLDYILKCYEKSPFASHVSPKSPPKNQILARLSIKISKENSPTIDTFRFYSHPDKCTFELICSENIFFLFPIIEQVLRKIFYILFFKYDGFILHASCVVKDDTAYLFSGESGAGKSSVARKLGMEGKEVRIVADNNTYIKNDNGNYYVYRPAFLEWNLFIKTAKQKDKYSIQKFYFLEKANQGRQSNIAFAEAFKKIYKQIQIPIQSLALKETSACEQNIFQFLSYLKEKGGIKVLNHSPKTNLSKIVFSVVKS